MTMALPMIAAMFLNMMYNLVDSLWIGNLLGETAYAALTNSTPIILILTSVAMGATNGVSILLSQAIGAKDKKRTESLIATSFCVAVVFSVLVTVILELLLPSILSALNTPAETYDMAYSYLSVYVLGYIAIYLYCYLEFDVPSDSHADNDDPECGSGPYFHPFHWIQWRCDCDPALRNNLPLVYAGLSQKEEIVYIQDF